MDTVPPVAPRSQVSQSSQPPNFSGVIQNLKLWDPDDPAERHKIKGALSALESYAPLIGGNFSIDFGLLKSNFDAGNYNAFQGDVEILARDKTKISDEDFLTGTISALHDLKTVISSNAGHQNAFLEALKTIASPTYLWKGPLGNKLSAHDFTEADTNALQLKIQDLINQIV